MQQQQQIQTTVEVLRPSDNIFVNGTEVDKEHPAKVAKIEVIENKVITSVSQPESAEKKCDSEPVVSNQIQLPTAITTTPTKSAATPAKETEIKKKPSIVDKETSIVTADYIQQSMHSKPFFLCKIVKCKTHCKATFLIKFPRIFILAIQNALRQVNLNPEIEEKLLNLQRCHEKQMKGGQRPTAEVLANNHHEYTSPGKYPSGSRKHSASRTEDEDWILDTPKRRPPRTTSFSEKKNAQNAVVIENDVDRIIRSVAEESTSTQVSSSPVARADAQISPVKKPAANTVATVTSTSPAIPTSPVKATATAIAIATANAVESSVGNDAKVAIESSPNEKNRRLAAIKRDNEKKKQMQVCDWKL